MNKTAGIHTANSLTNMYGLPKKDVKKIPNRKSEIWSTLSQIDQWSPKKDYKRGVQREYSEDLEIDSKESKARQIHRG